MLPKGAVTIKQGGTAEAEKGVVQLHFEEKCQVECRKKNHHIEYKVQNGKKKVVGWSEIVVGWEKLFLPIIIFQMLSLVSILLPLPPNITKSRVFVL